MIILAYFFPKFGSEPVLSQWASYGVSLIFFFYGLKLKPRELIKGLKKWKIHTLIQISTFLLFPLVILAIRPLFKGDENYLLWLSLFFMGSLPSAISSAVVMVSMAKGNVVASIFNATFSALLGVILTPLWMGFIVSETSFDIDFYQVFQNLFLSVILPLILGLVLQRKIRKWTVRNTNFLRIYDQAIILLIIFTSFAKSFEKHIFADYTIVYILLLWLGLIILFCSFFTLLWLISGFLGMKLPDRITVAFNGSTKSLIHGSVMSKIIFSNAPFLGILLLPIMLYHSTQLIILGIMSTRFSKKDQ